MKGKAAPTGNTEFQFKAGDLNFHSESYEWLVVAGAKAMYQGVGMINGAGAYKFILSAVDADINVNDVFDIDLFRIKIWLEDEETAEEIVLYDSQAGHPGVDPELDDDADPITPIADGSIVVHATDKEKKK